MKKIIKLALVLLVLASCAPQTRMVKIQRVKMYKGNDYAIGPAVHIELTDKQLKHLISSEESIMDNLASGDEGAPIFDFYDENAKSVDWKKTLLEDTTNTITIINPDK